MESMILVITFSLSNGGEVIYELDESYYSQRVHYKDNEGGIHDCLTLHSYDSSIFHEFITQNGEVHYYCKPLTDPIVLEIDEKEFQNSREPFILDEFQGLEQIQLIPPGIKVGHFYIYIKELNELYPDRNIRHIAPIINEGFILAFSDVTGLKENFLSRPVSVQVEWKDSFSPFILNKIEAINNSQN